MKGLKGSGRVEGFIFRELKVARNGEMKAGTMCYGYMRYAFTDHLPKEYVTAQMRAIHKLSGNKTLVKSSCIGIDKGIEA